MRPLQTSWKFSIQLPASIVSILLLIGCASRPVASLSHDAMDAIAVCNGGLEIKTGAELNANLAKVAQGSVDAAVAVKEELVGLIARDLKVSEEQAVLFYKEYVDCVQSKQSVKELLVILKSRAKVVEKNLEEDGYTDLVSRFKALYPVYFDQLENGQAVAAYETYKSIQTTLVSAAARKSNGGDWSDMMQMRFNLSMGGKPMTPADFDAWLQQNNFRRAKSPSVPETSPQSIGDSENPGEVKPPPCCV